MAVMAVMTVTAAVPAIVAIPPRAAPAAAPIPPGVIIPGPIAGLGVPDAPAVMPGPGIGLGVIGVIGCPFRVADGRRRVIDRIDRCCIYARAGTVRRVVFAYLVILRRCCGSEEDNGTDRYIFHCTILPLNTNISPFLPFFKHISYCVKRRAIEDRLLKIEN